MKKFLLYAMALFAATMTLSSCSNEEDMIFDDSAANRLDKAKAELTQKLSADGGKWSMEYFSNGGEHGYNYVMTFDPSGVVTIAGNNEWIGNTFRSEQSLWEVITDDGVVLTFNTYNSIFHIFSAPDDYEDSSSASDEAGIDHTGNGHLGDYEFIYIETSDDGNTIKLKGKKRGIYIYLHRLPADTSDEEFVASAVSANNSMFSTKIKEVYLTMPDGKSYVVSNNKGIISAYPEGGDAITQTSSANAIITPTGMRFMKPFAIIPIDSNDSIYVQSFALQADGTLHGNDDLGEGAVIHSGALSNLFVNNNITWRVDQKALGGIYDEKIPAAVAELKSAINGQLQNIEFAYDPKAEVFQLQVLARIRVGSSNKNATFNFLYTVEKDGDNVVLTYVGPDTTITGNYLGYMPSMQDVIDCLNGATVVLTAENRLATTTMKLSTSDTDYMTINIK